MESTLRTSSSFEKAVSTHNSFESTVNTSDPIISKNNSSGLKINITDISEQDVSKIEKQRIAQQLLNYKIAGAHLLNTQDYFKQFIHRKNYQCHFPKMFLEIYSNGNLLDCGQVDKPIGNIKTETLERLLQHPRIEGMIKQGEELCCAHSNADRIDLSNLWRLNPEMLMTFMNLVLGKYMVN
jgi:MoaA/NifB/PqqE/SkfB family radical SAM enzyme